MLLQDGDGNSDSGPPDSGYNVKCRTVRGKKAFFLVHDDGDEYDIGAPEPGVEWEIYIDHNQDNKEFIWQTKNGDMEPMLCSEMVDEIKTSEKDLRRDAALNSTGVGKKKPEPSKAVKPPKAPQGLGSVFAVACMWSCPASALDRQERRPLMGMMISEALLRTNRPQRPVLLRGCIMCGCRVGAVGEVRWVGVLCVFVHPGLSSQWCVELVWFCIHSKLSRVMPYLQTISPDAAEALLAVFENSQSALCESLTADRAMQNLDHPITCSLVAYLCMLQAEDVEMDPFGPFVFKDEAGKQMLIEPAEMRQLTLPGTEKGGCNDWEVKFDREGQRWMLGSAQNPLLKARDCAVVLAGRKAKDIAEASVKRAVAKAKEEYEQKKSDLAEKARAAKAAANSKKEKETVLIQDAAEGGF